MFGHKKALTESKGFDFYWSPEMHQMVATLADKKLDDKTFYFPYSVGGNPLPPTPEVQAEAKKHLKTLEPIGRFRLGCEAASYRAAEFINRFEQDEMTCDGLLDLRDQGALKDIPCQAVFFYIDNLIQDPEAHAQYPGAMKHANEWLGINQAQFDEIEKFEPLIHGLVEYLAYDRDEMVKKNHEAIARQHAKIQKQEQPRGRMSIDY